MRKIMIFLCLLPEISLAQNVDQEIILTPNDYLVSGVDLKEIKLIEFISPDSNIHHAPKVYAAIYPRDGFGNNYSIGQVLNYQTSKFGIEYLVKIILKDGQEIIISHTIDISHGLYYTEDFYDAVYSPDIYFWDKYEGMIISAN